MIRFAVLLLLAFGLVYAGYPLTVNRVLDGDTVNGDVTLWPGLTQQVRIRVYGVDTPEIHTRDDCEKRAGYRAKAYVEDWLKDSDVSLEDVQLGKYAGRVVGRIEKGDRDLSTDLLNGGYALPYYGGTKQKFECKK